MALARVSWLRSVLPLRPRHSTVMRPKALAPILVGLLLILHQDFWFWREVRPLVLGFVPIGLFWHLLLTLGASATMLLWVRSFPGPRAP